MLILLIHPLYVMAKPTETDYKNEKEIVLNYLNSDKGRSLVITDPLMKHGYPYYFKFNPYKNYTYVSNQNLKDIEAGKFDNVWILINKKTISGLQDMGYYFPDFYLQPFSQWQLIIKRGDVALYKATSLEDFKKYY